MRTAAVALLLLLAACGGGSDEPAAKPAPTKTSTAGSATPTATPTPAPATGVAAPEALSRFRCEKDAKGVWNAAGFLSNTAKTARTFQVTVYIGAATGGPERARTRQVPSVAAGGSIAFRIKKVPAPEEDAPCHVQVLVTK